MEQKKLFLLDAMALIYRAYYAFNNSKNPNSGLINSKGMNTSAVFGFTLTLVDLIEKEQPTHIAVAFDTFAPTSRSEEFSDYKANRESTPEDIVNALPYIKELIQGFNIPVLELDGYEADDIIGTLAKKAEQANYEVYMVTPDKDYMQLVSEKVFMYKPAYQGKPVEIYGIPEVLKKWGIKRIDQVIDMLGLQGDAVDNIPGIPGVGPKTAQKLIEEYDTVENLLDHADELKGKLKEKVESNKEQAIMSKSLATIILDVPIEFNEKDLTREQVDKEKLTTLFSELEFRTLGKRVIGEEYSVTATGGQMDLFASNGDSEEMPSEAKNIENTDHTYHLVNTESEIQDLIKRLEQQSSFCFDTETTGINPNDIEIVGLSVSFKEGEAYYVPLSDNQEEAKKTLSLFKNVFDNEKVEKIGQNIKYDIIVLKWYDVEVKGTLFDTMLAHYIIEPDMRHNMNILAENYLRYSPVSIETLIGKKGKNQKSMRDVPVEEVVEYAGEDADITLQISEKLRPELKEKKGEKLFNEIEAPLLPILADMEYEGVKVDVSFLENYSIELEKDILDTEKSIYELSGSSFNIASPKQLGEILFDKMGIEYKGKKTKTGQYSTNEETLNKIKEDNEIVQKILDFRQLSKLKSTYVDALPKEVNSKTGRIHTTFSQAVAATGRLSSDKPNLQNIPIRTEKGREIRKAFIPRSEEHMLLSADYSQIELRLVAAISKDEAMMQAFQDGTDIHTATAARVNKVELDAVTPEMRRNAKTVNFGIIYGISAFGLAERTGISRTEAKELIEQYFASYPNIKKYMDDTIQFAKDNGYVETLLGRRRYLRDINSSNFTVRGFAERNAINAPIQGSAADMIKIAMINIYKEFKSQNLKSKMVLQVHDELVFDVLKNEENTVKEIVIEQMRSAIDLDVPIEVEVGIGNNWLEAH